MFGKKFVYGAPKGVHGLFTLDVDDNFTLYCFRHKRLNRHVAVVLIFTQNHNFLTDKDRKP